jgi:RNA processing factor Prp31
LIGPRQITTKPADDNNHQEPNPEASMYSTDIKTCARQIVKESLSRILAGTYDVPSLEEMKLFLEQNFDHSFDEYLITQKIKRSHPAWSRDQIIEELDRQKRHYENELRVNLRIAALNTIEEIENLIISLNNAIREWKVLHL